MKKSLFYWVFLVLAGMSLTACSSGDDNIADNTTPVTPDSQNRKVILTGTIGIGGDETRAVNNNGEISWTNGDKVRVQYQTSTGVKDAEGTITKVTDHDATFEATLDGPTDDGLIGIAYPYSHVTAGHSSVLNFTFDYSQYTTQDGTTSSITSNKLDYACSESAVHMKVDGSSATLKGNALLKNQFSMYKFNLSTAADKLEIYIGESNFNNTTATYTVDPDDEATEFYVALRPKDSGDKVRIVASFTGQGTAKKLDATTVNAISSADYGKFISVDATDGNQAYLCSYSTSTKACDHTYGIDTKFVKGKFYSSNLTVKDLTPTAVIAYTDAIAGYCTKFLALALEDVYTDNTKSLHDASAYLMGENNWAKQHQMKISNTTYDDAYSSAYDQVRDNTLDVYGVIVSTYASNSNSAGTSDKGWRTPSVTDLRYILQELKNGNSYVINQNKITATSPTGITDQDGFYYSGQTDDTSSFAKYGTGGGALYTYINNLCGNSNLKNNYYWLSSQVINRSGSSQTQKAWRFSFSADQFEWNENSDESWLRLVFAY